MILQSYLFGCLSSLDLIAVFDVGIVLITVNEQILIYTNSNKTEEI